MCESMKIAGISTTRADYGLLYWPFKNLIENGFDLKIVVTAGHLSSQQGYTYRHIEADGFKIDAKLDILSGRGDTPLDAVTALGAATTKFGECFDEMKPDLILLLGDRYEILGAAQAALLMCIPVAHIAGGDITEGAFDESIRHAVTKMSHLHFATNAQSAERIRQLGENPKNVHNTGSPGLDFIRNTKLLSQAEIATQLEIEFLPRNILVTFHPETLNEHTVPDFAELLAGLAGLESDIAIIFTRPNVDPSGLILNQMIDDFVKTRKHTYVFTSLGSLRYLSLLAIVDAIVGNSSSGIYEAVSLKTATVNVGGRQAGRLQPSTVFNCQAQAQAIRSAITLAMNLDCSNESNPYGDGKASDRMVQILNRYRQAGNLKSLLQKSFFS